MHCYLDDLRHDLMHIGNDVTISYGVYFACHGRNQISQPITIKDGAYVGMRATIISKNAGIPGGGYWRGSNYRRKGCNRLLYSCESRCTTWCYRSRRALQNYRQNRIPRGIMLSARLRNEVAI